jgi:SIR2-like domain/Domain of unknown function (DUF4020)
VWITGEVDLPQVLLDALDNGTLVLFVGAGASRPPPSCLPDFKALVDQVYESAGRSVAKSNSPEPLDYTIARLKSDHGVDVHQRVAEIIGNPDSTPNDLHRAIAKVAASSGAPRIITTNYDLHISTAMEADVSVFNAPALPVGDDFDGIVYLHGSLALSPRHLVVTDEDFGRAYLTDGWATRFLNRMFRHHVVLFIGYSHNDVVMNYLARGLPAGTQRFALTDDPNADRWRHLGVQAVGYPDSDGAHSAVGRFLTQWAEVANYGLLDHRHRTQQLMSGPVPLVPEDIDYMRNLFSSVVTARFFTEFAKSVEWLEWVAAAVPAFERLFAVGTSEDPVMSELASWFCREFILDPSRSEAAFDIAKQHGFTLSATLRRELSWLFASAKPSQEILDRWVPLLTLSFEPGAAFHWAEMLEQGLLSPGSSAFVALFDACHQPRFSTFGAKQLVLSGDHSSLRRAWKSVVQPHLARLADELLPLVEGHLRRAMRLDQLDASPGSFLDAISYGRAAIEDHEQDKYPRPVGLLISELRDLLEHYLSRDSPTGLALLARWEGSGAAVLRRLAVHGWSERTGIDATAKLTKLLDEGWLDEWELKHEAYRLIATISPELTPEQLARICEFALAQYSLVDHESEKYEAYNLLVWLQRHRPDEASVADALEQVQTSHPDWQPREFPDLRSGGRFVVHEGGHFEAEIEPFHNQVRSNISLAGDEILARCKGREYDPESWLRLSDVRAAVAIYPEDGVLLLNELDSRDSDTVIVRQAILDGLTRATVSADLVDPFVAAMTTLAPNAHLRDSIATNLEKHSGLPSGANDFVLSPGSADLARALWSQWSSQDETTIAWSDAYLEAKSHWAGKSAQFWVHRISVMWKDQATAWQGIPPDARSALESMIGGNQTGHRHAKVVLASHLSFLFAADEIWATTFVLPLLDWSTKAAARNWSGFLAQGRWSNHLLDKGLLDASLATIGHLTELRDDDRQGFAGYMANVALFGSGFAHFNGLVKLLMKDAPLQDLVAWTNAVGWVLRELEPQQTAGLWEQVLCSHINNRVSGKPTPITVEEASALAHWTVHLGDHFEEAAALVSKMPGRLEPDSHLLYLLGKSDLPARFPSAVALLLTQLLQSAHPNLGPLCNYLEPIAKTVKDKVSPNRYKLLVEAALPLCIDAANW